MFRENKPVYPLCVMPCGGDRSGIGAEGPVHASPCVPGCEQARITRHKVTLSESEGRLSDGHAIGNFNAIITNLQATQMAALMVAQNTFYATVQKDAAMEAFSHSRYLSYVYAQAPTTYGYSSLAYWTAYFTATAPNYYTTMLTSFYLQAGYTQDAHSYYSKEDYLGYIKTYFGTNYYDSLMTYYLTASQHFSEAFTLNEVYIYGSSRIGVVNSAYRLRKRDFDANYNYLTGAYSSVTNMKDTLTTQNYTYKTMERGLKGYELTNHLGNVLAIITDAWYIDTCIEEVGIRYAAHITQATDYSAFGAPLPGRTWYSSKQYRQSFNGKEKDSETELQDYGMRIYNSRLGRFLSVDPLTKSYPMLTPYQFASNNPIANIDIDGKEGENHIYAFYDKVGYALFKMAMANGFSVIGSISIIAHANIETGYLSQKSIDITHNLWNFGPIGNKNQTKCGSVRWACFNSYSDAFDAYVDRISSKPDLIEYKNPNFNPSYPELGKLFRSDKMPTSADILNATRIKLYNGKIGKAGDYAYDPGNLSYGDKFVSAIKQAARQFDSYLGYRIGVNEKTIKDKNKEIANYQSQIKYANGLPATNGDWDLLKKISTLSSEVKNLETENKELKEIKGQVQQYLKKQ